MSTPKKSLTSKVAAGAVLVALSGFVPQPLMQQANAASASLSVTGNFISGITMSAGANVIFGQMIATANTGHISVNAAGTAAQSKANFLGTPKVGTYKFNAKAGGLNVDLTADGFKTGVAAAGPGAQGSFTFNKLYLNGPFTAKVTIAKGGGTTGKALAKLGGTAGASVTTNISAGARIQWNTTKPIGTFSFPATLTVTY